MKVNELAAALDGIFPAELSEEWDRDGRMVIPDGDAEVKKALCALDCTSNAIKAAAAKGCNVIVTHHPLLFRPLASLTEETTVGKRVLLCVKNGLAVLSYHTRLDSMEGGVNDCLADALGLRNRTAFLPFARIGDLGEGSGMPFARFRAFVSERLDEKELLCVNAGKPVRRVAVMSGSGKDGIEAALKAGADTYVTGEVPHDRRIECAEAGLNLVCASHHATERVVLPFLAEQLGRLGVPAEIHPFTEAEEYGV